MKNCLQTKTQNVLEHGISVHNYFEDIYQHIIKNTPLKFNWKLPEWIYEKHLWENLVDYHDIKLYQIYHDCGKPFCLVIDENKKRHFPNHAQMSNRIWKHLSNNNIVAELISKDMDIHLIKAEQCNDFALNPLAATLLITGLCEIHSNAEMFGGITSTSFKIKWKQINNRGKKIIPLIKQPKGEKS